MSCREPRAGQRNLGSYLAKIEGLTINREPSFFLRARFKNEPDKRTVLVSYPYFGLGFNLTVIDDQEARFNEKQLDDFIMSGEYPSGYVEPKPEIKILGTA